VPLSEISRSALPTLDQFPTGPMVLPLAEKTTYVVAHINANRTLFGAIRILKMDAKGIRFEWKRIATEAPIRSMKFTAQGISPVPGYALATMNIGRPVQSNVDRNGFSDFNPGIKFDEKNGTLTIEERVFPDFTGIVDVTANYVSLEVIPVSVDANFAGVYQAAATIRIGARYLIATETFKKRSVDIIEVMGFVPGKSVTVKYKRLAEFVAQPFDR